MNKTEINLRTYLVRPKATIQWTAIAVQLVMLTIFHNSIYLESHPFQMMVVQKMFFVPVILAGFWTNARGGLVVAALSAILYPHRGYMEVHANHQDHEMYTAGQSSDIVLLFIVGGMMGLLRNLLEKESEQHRRTAKERDAALKEAFENFEVARENDRLAMLGQMVAGIAHEVGNPLTAMQCSIEVLKRSIGKDPGRDGSLLELLNRETIRLDGIVRRFLDYARPREPVLQTVDTARLVKEGTDLTRFQMEKKGYKLNIIQQQSGKKVKCDPGQIVQVIVNLLLNAYQFAKCGSEIEVISNFERGEWILSVANDGEEIPEEMVDKIFEPFVTTRAEGSGLGLAVAQRIVRSHGGTLSCRSGEKTEFIVKLPVEKE